MGFTSENKPEKQITMGILAHVDAGKTTLSEGILYTCKAIRKLGRVDHQDAFLDTNTLERNRGITIFSKQAECTLGEFGITLLDTPGHVDFSAEMERTLQVLDYGILVISGADTVAVAFPISDSGFFIYQQDGSAGNRPGDLACGIKRKTGYKLCGFFRGSDQ